MKDLDNLYSSLIGKSLEEAIGDNAIDNMIDSLKRVSEVELSMFISKLLITNVNKFIMSYENPEYEKFKATFSDIIARYQVMDAEEKGDLFQKIENMFKDIFIKNYAGLGPDFAETTGSLYAKQMVNILKSLSIQANAEIFSPKRIY